MASVFVCALCVCQVKNILDLLTYCGLFHFPQIMAQEKESPKAHPKQNNKLDNMLGSLQSDLNRLGVQTVAKGLCGACKKPIVGQVIKQWRKTTNIITTGVHNYAFNTDNS